MKYTVNKQHIVPIVPASQNSSTNTPDFTPIDTHTFITVWKHKVYRIHILSSDFKENRIRVQVNQRVYDVPANHLYEDILQKIGIEIGKNKTVPELLAPMPGKVVEIFVKEGEFIQKGQRILSLEAMKMENILTATEDAYIESICINTFDTIEKGQLLVKYRTEA